MTTSLTEHLAEDVRASRSSHWFGAFVALFQASARRYLWSKRALVIASLFVLPSAICLLTRQFDDRPRNPKWYTEQEMLTILVFIPTLLTPLAGLLYGAGMIQDEIEEQTLTYLLVRPIPRPAIYVAKLLACLLATTVISVVFTLLAYVCLRYGTDGFTPGIFPNRALKTACLLALLCTGYCSLFAFLCLLVKRSLIVGTIYIIFIEGLLAAIPFNLRLVTIVYHYRLLAIRWLDLDPTEWNIKLADAPNASTSLMVFAGIAIVTTILGGRIMKHREFRMKTPSAS